MNSEPWPSKYLWPMALVVETGSCKENKNKTNKHRTQKAHMLKRDQSFEINMQWLPTFIIQLSLSYFHPGSMFATRLMDTSENTDLSAPTNQTDKTFQTPRAR